MRQRTWLLGVFVSLIALELPALPASAAQPEEKIVLVTGEVIIGQVIDRTEEVVVIEHPVFGRLTLPVDKIKKKKPVNPGLFGTDFLKGWKRSISLGFNGKQGTSVSTNITAGLNASYTDPTTRWRFTGRWFFNDGDDDDNENNATVRLTRDWLFPESIWFAYSSFSYDYDAFESWQHRTAITVGPAWHLIQRETFTLDFRSGVNYTREFGERQANKMDLPITFDLTWVPTEGQTVTASNTLFAELTDFGEFRNVTRLEWKIALSVRYPLALTLGANNEYETLVEPGDQHNDLRYYGALTMDF
jgi:putative salt-induced outer membrane protein YdiY